MCKNKFMERHYQIIDRYPYLKHGERSVFNTLLEIEKDNLCIIPHGKAYTFTELINHHPAHIRKILVALERRNIIKNVSEHRQRILASKVSKKEDRKRYNNAIRISRDYNLSENDYNQLIISQNNKCAICSKDYNDPNKGKLDIDHCHATGKVRGLLCRSCNTAIGKFKDNPELLKKAIDYLTKQ